MSFYPCKANPCFSTERSMVMKLYMQKDMFRWGVPLPLRDKSGRVRYTVNSDAYALGKRLHVTDLAGREALYIHQQIPSLFPRFQVEVYGRPVAQVVKDLSYFRPRYSIEMVDWTVLGNLSQSDYEITCQNTVVASCRPQQSQEGTVLALEFMDRSWDLAALGVILALTCLLSPQGSERV